MKSNVINILGIDFFNGHVKEVVENLKKGGLLVVPSGPGLASISSDITYYRSLKAADVVIADSGYMALIWNTTHSKKVNRISGLEFLNTFFSDEEIRKDSDILLVNPREIEAALNLSYLNGNGFSVSKENSYIAPIYGKENIEDEALMKLLEEKKPRYVIINLGGGVQEILGAYLKNNLSYKPAIICTGAAIAFLTGEQAHIPYWADKLFLGWLMRCIEKPKQFVPRYINALKLVTIMLQYNPKTQIN
ncbi:WecB/TagA/CpsF family glycosyltransferase [Anditalea andensis]|uniref:WecB/TagA/CpsF family glycosyltransferase n=1 Tax=Anditalea andensis TaxID=1048983 RepID=UPI0013DE8FDA|nr:WecB/TagA/CpsF family glycosyltransferase [Anditalea andensis]